MVGMNRSKVSHVPMEQVIANSPRLVSKDVELWDVARSLLINTNQDF